jgi:hypothetical protein
MHTDTHPEPRLTLEMCDSFSYFSRAPLTYQAKNAFDMNHGTVASSCPLSN